MRLQYIPTIPVKRVSQILLFGTVLLTAVSASAQTTILYDDFSGPFGGINGTTLTTGTGTWSAPSYVGLNGGGKLMTRQGGTSAARSTTYVSTTLSSGNIYELSVDINGDSPSSTSSQFAGFGFFSTVDRTWTKFDSQSAPASTPWTYLQTQSATSLGDMSLRPEGQYIDGYSTIDSNFDVTTSRNYKLILNTSDTDSETAGDQFSLALFVDGVQYGTTFTYDSAASAALLSDVVGVGVTADIASGGSNAFFDNFLLTATAAVPEPGSFALLAGFAALTTTLIRNRRNPVSPTT
tara:strand:- start:1952 stop:2833 length:882 start_codon:yes stop_codon:yes gene_type:complete